MSKITNQAQWAIDKMMAAGWQRGDFSVRTQTHRFSHDGAMVTEYGNANIYISSRALLVEKVGPMVQAGLNVRLYLGDKGWWLITVNDRHGEWPLTIVDSRSGGPYKYCEVPIKIGK